jgi:hypothetical protein
MEQRIGMGPPGGLNCDRAAVRFPIAASACCENKCYAAEPEERSTHPCLRVSPATVGLETDHLAIVNAETTLPNWTPVNPKRAYPRLPPKGLRTDKFRPSQETADLPELVDARFQARQRP